MSIFATPYVCCILMWIYKRCTAKKIKHKEDGENCQHFEGRVVGAVVDNLSSKQIKKLEYKGQKEELDSDGEALWQR
jgi:hypothetical protein